MVTHLPLTDLPDIEGPAFLNRHLKRVVDIMASNGEAGVAVIAIDDYGNVEGIGALFEHTDGFDPLAVEYQRLSPRPDIGLMPLLQQITYNFKTEPPLSRRHIKQTRHRGQPISPFMQRIISITDVTVRQWFRFCLVGGLATTCDLHELLETQPAYLRDEQWHQLMEGVAFLYNYPEDLYSPEALAIQRDLVIRICPLFLTTGVGL